MASQPASTGQKHGFEPYQWKPGQSGNPAGRTKGSRNKLGEEFVDDLLEHWKAHGGVAIERLFNSDIAAYMNVIARIIPKEVIHTVREYDDLDDDALDQLILDTARRIVADARSEGPKALPAPVSDEPPLVIAPRAE